MFLFVQYTLTIDTMKKVTSIRNNIFSISMHKSYTFINSWIYVMNQVSYPINKNLNSEIITMQFKNTNISTSYFLNAFKNINPYSIQNCFINNTFTDDVIELIACLKCRPDDLIDNTTLDDPLSASTLAPPAGATTHASSIHTTTADSSFDELKKTILTMNSPMTSVSSANINQNSIIVTQFQKLFKLYEIFNVYIFKYKHDMRNIYDIIISILNAIRLPDIFQLNDLITNVNIVLYFVANVLSSIGNSQIDTINYIFNEVFNQPFNLNINILAKLNILIKYVNYIHNKNHVDKIIEITSSFVKKHLYILDSVLHNVFAYYIIYDNPTYQIDKTTNFHQSIVDFIRNMYNPNDLADETTKKIIEQDIILTAINASYGQFTFFSCTTTIDNIILSCFNIANMITSTYKCTPLFNTIVELMNFKIKLEIINIIIVLYTKFYTFGTTKYIDYATLNNIFISQLMYRYNVHASPDENSLTAAFNGIAIETYNDILKLPHLEDSLLTISAYIVSQQFSLDIAAQIRTRLKAIVDNNQKHLLINRLGNEQTSYGKEVIAYLSSKISLSDCLKSLNASDIRKPDFISLFSVIFIDDSKQDPLVRLDQLDASYLTTTMVIKSWATTLPDTTLNSLLDASTIKILANKIKPNRSTNELVLSTNKLSFFDDNITFQMTPPLVEVKPKSSSLSISIPGPDPDTANLEFNPTYSLTILDDLISNSYTQYQINDSILPEEYDDNIINKYKICLKKHYEGLQDTSTESIENTFRFKYATAYSRMYLIYIHQNVEYTSIVYSQETNSFNEVKTFYKFDSRIPVVINLISKCNKLELLELFTIYNNDYITSKIEERKKIINEVIQCISIAGSQF